MWCTRQDGTVLVQSIQPVGLTLQSPLESALDAAVTELFDYRDVWRRSTSTQAADGSLVTGSGRWDHCVGLPLLGKIHWVKRFPKALRYAADLLRKVDGRFDDAAQVVPG